MDEFVCYDSIEVDVFDKNSEFMQVYGKFKMNRGEHRYIYIPLENGRVRLKSFKLYSTLSILRKIYIKLLSIFIYIFNPKFVYEEVIHLGINEDIKKAIEKIPECEYISVYNGYGFKYVLQLMDSNAKILGYMKVSTNEFSRENIYKEVKNIKYVESLGVNNIPKIKYFDKERGLFIQDTKNNLEACKKDLSLYKNDFFDKSIEKTLITHKLKESEFYSHINQIIENYGDENISNLLIKVRENIKNKYNMDEVKYCFSHGDFTERNVKVKHNNLYIYDWELAGMKPIYYDAFFYLIRFCMDNRMNTKSTVMKILNSKYIEEYEKNNNIDKRLRKPMLMICLCEMIYSYIGEDIANKKNNPLSTKALNIQKELVKYCSL